MVSGSGPAIPEGMIFVFGDTGQSTFCTLAFPACQSGSVSAARTVVGTSESAISKQRIQHRNRWPFLPFCFISAASSIPF